MDEQEAGNRTVSFWKCICACHERALSFILRGMILGIDEAGRGPWAGPLVVGAAVLGGAQIEGLTDSKKLTKKKREALYDIIREQAVACEGGVTL